MLPTMPPTMSNLVCERLVMSVPVTMHMLDFLQKFLASAQLGEIKRPEGRRSNKQDLLIQGKPRKIPLAPASIGAAA